MKTKITQGYYGSGNTPCNVICAEMPNGSTWYAVEGSQNVNCTHEEIELGVNVEEVADFDAFTWPDGIHSEADLAKAIRA